MVSPVKLKRSLLLGSWPFPAAPTSHPSPVSDMTTKSQHSKEQDKVTSLGEAISTLSLARDAAITKPTKDAFGSVATLLTTVRVGFILAHALLLLAHARRTRRLAKRIASN